MSQHRKVDVQQIQTVDVQQISSIFLSAVHKFYSHPQHLEDFDNWKKQKEKEAKKTYSTIKEAHEK